MSFQILSKNGLANNFELSHYFDWREKKYKMMLTLSFWDILGVVHKWRHGIRGKGFCEDSTKALVIKSVTKGVGVVKNYQILCDISYGRPLKAWSSYRWTMQPESWRTDSEFNCSKVIWRKTTSTRQSLKLSAIRGLSKDNLILPIKNFEFQK